MAYGAIQATIVLVGNGSSWLTLIAGPAGDLGLQVQQGCAIAIRFSCVTSTLAFDPEAGLLSRSRPQITTDS